MKRVKRMRFHETNVYEHTVFKKTKIAKNKIAPEPVKATQEYQYDDLSAPSSNSSQQIDLKCVCKCCNIL